MSEQKTNFFRKKGKSHMKLLFGIILVITTIFTPCWVYAQTTPSTTKPDTMHVIAVGPRALRDAIRVLERQLQTVIVYEDPSYTNPITTRPLFAGGPTIPKTHTIYFDYSTQSSPKAVDVVRGLLKQYSQQDKNSVFDVTTSLEDSENLNVKPIEDSNQKGVLTPYKSVLDNKVNVAESASYRDLAQRICSSISLSSGGTSVGFQAAEPQLNLLQDKLVCNNEAGRNCLDKLLADFNSQSKLLMSYYLDNDAFLPGFSAVIVYAIGQPQQNNVDDVQLSVEEDRPLAEATQILSHELNCTTIYEDPPWACDCEVMKDQHEHPQAPRGGVLTYSYSSRSDTTAIMAGCIKAYDAEDNPGQFSTRAIGNSQYVYPIASMTSDHKANRISKHILDNPVTFMSQNEELNTVLGKICASLAKTTNQPIVVGSVTGLISATHSLSYTSEGKPADVCLAELADRLGYNMSWHLLYNPYNQQYVLSGEAVAKNANAR